VVETIGSRHRAKGQLLFYLEANITNDLDAVGYTGASRGTALLTPD
jgi:hypothetical protein